jgi:hypothetical protein
MITVLRRCFLINVESFSRKYGVCVYINYQRPKRAVTEGQQTPDNFHRPMLHFHIKTLHQGRIQLNRIIFSTHTTFHDYNTL